MFDSVDTSKEVSRRLRQDMQPVTEVGSAPPPAAPTPSPPASPEPASMAPAVETAPAVLFKRQPQGYYLIWIAAAMILPSSLFWFVSLLYLVGVKSVLATLVALVPFPAVVSLNIIMPAAAASLAWFTWRRADYESKATAAAKIILLLCGLNLAALIFWLMVEAFQ